MASAVFPFGRASHVCLIHVSMCGAQAMQTILRREAYPNPYEALKELTRVPGTPPARLAKKKEREANAKSKATQSQTRRAVAPVPPTHSSKVCDSLFPPCAFPVLFRERL